MKLFGFNGKLATKVFLFFILASFIPLSITLVISYYHVKDIIKEDALYNLQSASKEYGIALFSRLKLAKDTLANNADSLFNEQLLLTAQNNLINYYSAVGIARPGERNAVLWGEMDPLVFQQDVSKATHILTTKKTDKRQDIYIRLSNGVYGKLNSKYLWDTKPINNEIDICVIDNHHQPLFCDAGLLSQRIKTLKHRFSEKVFSHSVWEQDSNLISGYWPLFMDHEFNIDDWAIITNQDGTIARNRVMGFKNLFIPVIIFSLLLVILLSSVIIRKNLHIVNSLIQGTRRIAKNDFDTRITIESKDEFGELASSFNQMSSSLSRVNQEYHALSQLDSSILSSKNSQTVISSVFNTLYTIADFASLTLINTDKSVEPLQRYYYQASNESSLYSTDDIAVSAEQMGAIGHDHLSLVSNSAPQSPILDRLMPLKGDHIVAIPIHHDAEKNIIIIASFNDTGDIDEFTKTKLTHFANRIALAFQALNREYRLDYRANHDQLTQIPNRGKLIDIFQQQASLIDNEQLFSALIFLDLDRFKQINDNHGHIAGDKVLQQVTVRIQNLIQHNCHLARLGGDEFAVLVNASNPTALITATTMLCNNIIAEANKPFSIDNHILHIGASIGVSLIPEHAKCFEEAMRFSDTAMYFSKINGRNRHTFYTPDMSEALLKKSLLERDLRQAVEQEEIEVHYQPKININNTLGGFEALLRWNHSTLGYISPLVVLEMAEEIGIINQLGRHIFKNSIAQLEQWLAQGYEPGAMAINVAPEQLDDVNFIDFIKTTLASTPLVKPSMLELEITENAMLKNKQESLKLLKQLQKMGLKIAIDDFGTGYSSLSYLLDIPASILKIDRSFIIKLEQDNDASTLLRSLIELGKSIGYSIVAEGIETEQQAEFLRQCGTDQLQGYLFSKPLSATQAERRFLQQDEINALKIN